MTDEAGLTKGTAIQADGLFQVTIGVVCYGDNPHLAERFLSSLYRYTNHASFHLRIGLNEVSAATRQIVQSFVDRFGNVEVYEELRNVFKAPLMRRMFTQHRISTEWLVWFDDDSYLTRPDWLQRLAIQIARFPHVAQWGQTYALWSCDERIEAFVKAASWYGECPFLLGTGLDGREMWEFRFVTGAFWAAKTAVISALDWPDARLIQAHDDFLFGEALRQNGWEIGLFEYGVKINASSRRNSLAPEVERLPAADSQSPSTPAQHSGS